MELSRPDFRLMTFCEYMKDLNQKKPFQNLKQHFDKNALIRTQAFFWFGLFRQDKCNFSDEHWCQTVTAVVVTNIKAAEILIRTR